MAGTATRKNFTYTLNDLVKKIEVVGTNAHTSEFFYDSSNTRYKRIDRDATGKVTTTLYLGNVEKIHNSDGSVQWKRQIGSVAQVTHAVTASSIGTGTRRYFHMDHLGSINAITNSAGAIEHRMAFDPWGARRTINSSGVWQPGAMTHSSILASYAKTAKPATTRGYTGHEMLDEVGIIHMNGRIYDAYLARFLQADPIIQEPTMVGSLNRYSYTMNNPLNAVDPSGFSWLSKAWTKIRPFVGAIVAVALTIVAPWGSGFWATVAYGAIAGAAGAAATGGNILKGALIGGVSAAAFYGVGETFNGAGGGGNFFGSGMKAGAYFAKVAAHGMVGGVMSVLQGGKFGHGFASAGFSQAFSGAIDGIGRGGDYFSAGNRALRIAAAAVTGGTASKMSGGKFANGAMTGAFSRAFNDDVHEMKAEASLKVKLAIGKIKGEYDLLSDELKGTIELTKDFKVDIGQDGSARITQGGKSISFGEGSISDVGIGKKILGISGSAKYNGDKLSFTGSVNIAKTLKIPLLDVSVIWTDSIKMDINGGLPNAARKTFGARQIQICEAEGGQWSYGGCGM